VPEVVAFEGGLVGAGEVGAAGDGFEHGQVAGLRLVEAG
jgi:hypothetical protein